jgi:ATP-binding protein involved in chromosome partitioning
MYYFALLPCSIGMGLVCIIFVQNGAGAGAPGTKPGSLAVFAQYAMYENCPRRRRMPVTKDDVIAALERITLPDGRSLVAHDMVRALSVEAGIVRFVIEAPNAEVARAMAPLRDAAEQLVAALPGVTQATVALTAHGPTAKTAAPPDLKIGGHPKPQDRPTKPDGVDRIIAIGSGKGGVGKSTVSTNLAVALARQGRKVGLLDADIYGPSIPRMMGVNQRPASPDGKKIIPLHAHGVTLMSIGFMLEEGKATIWRGPMLMGALQQMLGQVEWGPLDVLLVDLPPGTGDVQLTLCTKTQMTGAIVVSTPQDVALIDARKALDMFSTLKTPLLGLIENMSVFVCPDCGGQHQIFGQGGVAEQARQMDVPLLGTLPIDLSTRLAGDGGTPVATGDSPMAEAYAQIAEGLIARGLA